MDEIRYLKDYNRPTDEYKLNNGVIQFAFKKNDGTIRKAIGTTSNKIIPIEQRIKIDPEYTQKVRTYENKKDYIIWYWDLQKNGLRSFNTNKFEGIIKYTLVDDYLNNITQIQFDPEKFKLDLENNIIEFEYKKFDGTIRKAKGTTNEKYIDISKQPYFYAKMNSFKNRQEYIIWYWDIQKNGLRSFDINRFINIINITPIEITPQIDLLKLQKQIEEIFNERCDDYIQGNNTKESPIRANFSGKAYGEGYSLFLTIYNGQAYIEPDSSPYVFTRDSLRKAWLNRANELIQRYNIKFAQFCINKD